MAAPQKRRLVCYRKYAYTNHVRDILPVPIEPGGGGTGQECLSQSACAAQDQFPRDSEAVESIATSRGFVTLIAR